MHFNYLKIKKIFLSICFCLAMMSQAQNPTFTWAKQFGGTSYEDGRAIVLDAADNIYTTGNFSGTVDFDPGAGTFTLTSLGAEDIFVSKLDGAGNFMWAKQLGGTGSDFGLGIDLDAAGNVYVSGSFNGTADFDPGIATFTLISASLEDVFISKLNPAGNFVWAKQLGGIYTDWGRAIVVDAPGNVYTTGSFGGTADFDPGPGIFNLNAAGVFDIFISKIDAAGNFVWAKSMGGISYDEGRSIFLDVTGNVYTTGNFQNIADFDPDGGTYNLTSNGGSYDVFVSKLDVSGNFVWAKQWGGTSFDWGHDIAVDAGGNVYTCGSFNGTPDFDPGAGTFTLTSAGSNDVFVSKLDASGNLLWAKQWGAAASDNGNSIDLDALSNIYITGQFQNTFDVDPGAGTFTLTSLGVNDVFVSKLNASGNFIWAKQWGGTLSDGGSCIAVDAAGNVYTTGTFQNLVDFDPNAGAFTLTAVGNSDAFVHKMGQCLEPAAPDNTTPPVNQNICVNTNATLTASSNGTINWYATPAGTLVLGTGTAYITPTLSIGTYTYYAEAVTCDTSLARTAITVTVSSCVGITEISKLVSEVNVYPNPFNKKLTVVLIGGKHFLQIYNALGVLVLERRIENEFSEIDLSEQTNGIYFFRIGTFTKKIIKE